MYRGWTQIEYQNKHHNIDQKDEGTFDDRRRDGGTNLILRIKEQETCLTLHEHDDDDDEVLGHEQSHHQAKELLKKTCHVKYLTYFTVFIFVLRSQTSLS